MFRVRWERRALDKLAQIWLDADSSSKEEITIASAAVDQRLRSDPLQDSESRPKGRRITFVPPLTITFRIEPDGKTVSVLDVRFFRRRSS
jgi:hypothetical protein